MKHLIKHIPIVTFAIVLTVFFAVLPKEGDAQYSYSNTTGSTMSSDYYYYQDQNIAGGNYSYVTGYEPYYLGNQPSFSYEPIYVNGYQSENIYHYGYQQPLYNTGYQPETNYSYGYHSSPYYNQSPYVFTNTGTYDNNKRKPRARTENARNIEEDEAELRGEVDMNDFDDGIVFFVYGQDEDAIEDVEDDYDEYDEVRDDEEDDDFEVERVDSNLDGQDDYRERVTGLEEDEEYYYVICVEYKDDDNDETLECGNVENFETDDENNNDEEPEVETLSAQEIDNDSALLRGEVEMNDYNDGIAFFVYGEDENQVEDAEYEDRYSDIDEDDEDLQTVIHDIDVDGNQDFERTVTNLNGNTTIYFRLCIQYEDNDDEHLACGNVRDFETD